MSTQPVNILQQVATYSDPALAYLKNLNCFVSTLNTKYKDFEKQEANLGSTINLELPTRAVASQGLVASFQPAVQTLVPLICDQAANSSMAFSAQQFIFNAREYMEKFGKSRVMELSTFVEKTVALNAISGVPVMTIDSSGQSIPTGALHTESGPYRFFDATAGFTGFQQVAQMLAQFRNFGAAEGPLDVYLDDYSPVNIIGSGLTQFVLDRNEKFANSWDLGTYRGSNAKFYQSNLLPTQYAGTLGNAGTTLTLTSFTNTTDSSGLAITQLTFSGAGSASATAVNSGDLGYFLDGVGSFQNMRYLTWIGHTPSKNQVQFRATATAASSGGNVTVNVYPQLISTPGQNQNLNQPLQAGMQVKFLGSHRAGLIVGGKGFYLAMPRLPNEEPYPTSVAMDRDTGVSLRLYYGSRFGQNFRGLINDCVFASLAVPDYCMRICLPV